jgi:hypothetical protein
MWVVLTLADSRSTYDQLLWEACQKDDSEVSKSEHDANINEKGLFLKL